MIPSLQSICLDRTVELFLSPLNPVSLEDLPNGTLEERLAVVRERIFQRLNQSVLIPMGIEIALRALLKERIVHVLDLKLCQFFAVPGRAEKIGLSIDDFDSSDISALANKIRTQIETSEKITLWFYGPALPIEVRLLPRLKILENFHGEELPELSLPLLRELNLIHSSEIVLPQNFFLPNLEKLSLRLSDRKPISKMSFYASLPRLPRLENLSLLASFGETSCIALALPTLKSLELSSGITFSQLELPNLENLALGSSFQRLALPSLKKLAVNCPGWEPIEQNPILDLPVLEVLHSSGFFNTLPNLQTSLRVLRLDGRNVSAFPENLDTSKLEYLSLWTTSIASFPSKSFPSLKELMIANSRIAQFDLKHEDAPKLQKLDVSKTPMQNSECISEWEKEIKRRNREIEGSACRPS